MDELFEKVTKALKYCDEETEQGEQVCPDDCPYKRQCWSENPEDQGAAAGLVEDMKRLILQQQSLIMQQKQQIETLEKKYSALLDERIAELLKQINDEREKLIRAGAITAKDEEEDYGAETAE